MTNRRVAVLVRASGVCVDLDGRCAELVALCLAYRDRLNAPGVRKIVVNDTPAGLKLLVTYRAHALPDCGGEEAV